MASETKFLKCQSVAKGLSDAFWQLGPEAAEGMVKKALGGVRLTESRKVAFCPLGGGEGGLPD